MTGSFGAKGQDLKCLHRLKGNALQFALQIKLFHLLYDNPVQNHPPSVAEDMLLSVISCFTCSEMSGDHKGEGEGEGCGFPEAILSSASSPE